jgi:hypothetical protein
MWDRTTSVTIVDAVKLPPAFLPGVKKSAQLLRLSGRLPSPPGTFAESSRIKRSAPLTALRRMSAAGRISSTRPTTCPARRLINSTSPVAWTFGGIVANRCIRYLRPTDDRAADKGSSGRESCPSPSRSTHSLNDRSPQRSVGSMGPSLLRAHEPVFVNGIPSRFRSGEKTRAHHDTIGTQTECGREPSFIGDASSGEDQSGLRQHRRYAAGVLW